MKLSKKNESHNYACVGYCGNSASYILEFKNGGTIRVCENCLKDLTKQIDSTVNEEEPSTKPTTWEYLHLKVNTLIYQPTTQINEYGKQGWELVSAIHYPQFPTEIQFFFKRSVQ